MIGAWDCDAAWLASVACKLLPQLLCRQAGGGSRSCGTGSRSCGQVGSRSCGHVGSRSCGHVGSRSCSRVLPQLTAALRGQVVLQWAPAACKETKEETDSEALHVEGLNIVQSKY